MLVRVRWRSAQSFWTIGALRPTDRTGVPAEAFGSADGTVAVVGTLVGGGEQDELLLRGRWTVDPKYGPQFKFEGAELLQPSSSLGMQAWLETHLPGVGPGRARRIVEEWGSGDDGLAGVWQRLSGADAAADLQRFGLTADQARLAAETFRATRATRETDAWLRGLGTGPKTAAKIIEHFGDDTRKVLESDPYVLMELERFGFLTADSVARAMGVALDHPGRARACILHVLQLAAEGDGHTFLPLGSPEGVAKLPPERRKAHPARGLWDRVRELGVEGPAIGCALREMDGRAREWLERQSFLTCQDAKAEERRMRCMVIVEGQGAGLRASLMGLWLAEREVADRVRALVGLETTAANADAEAGRVA